MAYMFIFTQVNECVSSPCQYNGTCEDLLSGFTCTCVEGYNGTMCEEDIDECIATPCGQNKTCVNVMGSYECVCPDGFYGDSCENGVDECQSQPCLNGVSWFPW